MANITFPFDIVDVEPALNKQLINDFHGERTGFVQVGPKKYFMPVKYRDFAAEFYNFEVRGDDIFITTYPRSGTTVLQELVWLLANNLDYENAIRVPLFFRAPFLEFHTLVHEGLLQDVLSLVKGDKQKEADAYLFASNRAEKLQTVPSPRIIKSHFPLSLLPPTLLDKCKVVYMARNPKDMAVSYYHHNRLFTTQGYIGDFPTYWKYFQQDLLPWSPYWEHLAEAWTQRDHPNMLFLFYEDFVTDSTRVIQQVATHLGKSLNEPQIQRLAQHLSIENFKRNSSTNLDAEYLPGLHVKGEEDFIRKGKNHGWAPYFTEEMNNEADPWIEQNIARIPGFKFPSP